METINHYIDGRVVEGTSGRHGDVYNPALGEPIRRVAFADEGELDAAVAAATKAFAGWATTPPLRRARVLFRLKGLIEQHMDELAAVVTEEHGKTVDDAKAKRLQIAYEFAKADASYKEILKEGLEDSNVDIRLSAAIWLAMLDDLTGISNRRSFIAACNQHITDPNEHAHRTAFLLMDIDNFKSVNDRYGHDAGDIVLIEVAQLLQNKARQRDMVGRLGGEEFGVMLTNINPSQAVYASERILKSIAATQIRITPDTHISITMSGGLTMLKAEEPLSDSIKRADRLLYQAKNAGKACIQYDNASST